MLALGLDMFRMRVLSAPGLDNLGDERPAGPELGNMAGKSPVGSTAR